MSEHREGIRFFGGPRDGERTQLPEGDWHRGEIKFVNHATGKFWEGDYVLTDDSRLGRVFRWTERKTQAPPR